MRKFGKLLPLILLLAGCGGGGSSTPNNPQSQTATVSGQYTLVLTSTKNGTSQNIYVNITQSGTTLASDANTLACPGNLLENCIGDDAPAVQFILAGTVTGNAVQMSVPAGPSTVTLDGTVSGTSASGTYVDTLGDAGNWTATKAASFSGNYSGTLTPDSHPTISPTIMLSITQTPTLSLTATAVVTNSTCFTSLALTGGQAIGGAFTLSNSSPNILIIALPTSTGYIFQYNVGQDGACAGDSGRGAITKQ